MHFISAEFLKHPFIKKINLEEFFKYVEDFMSLEMKQKRKFAPGMFEYFIQDYFDTQVFKRKPFYFSEKFHDIVLQILKKHRNKVSLLLNPNQEGKEIKSFRAFLPEEHLIKYLVIAYPNYDPNIKLNDNIQAYNEYISKVLGINY